MPSPGRPAGDTPVANPKNLLRILAVFPLLASSIFGEHSHQQPVPQRHQSPHEHLDHDVSHTRKVDTTQIPQVDTPYGHYRRKNSISGNHHKSISNDASAIALAPTGSSAVAAPLSRRSNISSDGSASPQNARSLDDWEVEDFVLLATIDGKLYAQDRISGKKRWENPLEAKNPVVNSTHYRQNQSSIDEDYHPMMMDQYIWAIEPSHDGSLYIYRRNGASGHLVPTGLTMKVLVEETPYEDTASAITYIGKKETTMLVVEAATGKVVKYFGATDSIVQQQTCLNHKELAVEDSECKTSPTFTIGRTEYTVYINGADGHQIAKLEYSEWGPNNYDNDLQKQYDTTLDDRYIHTTSNGGIIGVDHKNGLPEGHGKRLFRDQFPTPVIRIFDVARPWGTEKDDPKLIILPQPMPPTQSDDSTSANDRATSVFLNQTEDGSWFALSGKHYPTAVQGVQPALCQQPGWYPHHGWDGMHDRQVTRALIGLHSVQRTRSDTILTIGPNDNASEEPEVALIPVLALPTPWQWIWNQLLDTGSNFQAFITNPMALLLLVCFILYKQKDIRIGIRQLTDSLRGPKLREAPIDSALAIITEAKEEQSEGPNALPNENVELPAVKVQEVADQVPDEIQKVNRASRANSLEIPQVDGAPTAEGGEKRARKRGTRGGQKHNKGKKKARSMSQDPSQDPKPAATVEDAVRDAQRLGESPKMEPDIHTLSHDPSEVSGPVIKVGALVVNTDKLIGTGSNGTMVFEGNFDGREVAVKRMLIQFFDIASQETKLLRESDDHPNVIRYYAQQQAAGFLYIALELCPASLADIISKPLAHPDLVRSGERDLPNVLYQIANGLSHLHTLRIVHRDLKPQNILVSMGKDRRPRLLVSDFGLCKKLEGEQSSFRATTAHAAGTTGWRAPELLLDDDAKLGATMLDTTSTNGDSGSGILVSADLMPNRRATRAIDIFSLGLVYFYVLTKGSHPFNSGGQWMREVNIRKGNYDLSPLDVLGDYTHEAKDLVASMLESDPRRRPNARQVMAHPFFWSTKKRLNFLCDVSDHFEKEIRDPPSTALLSLETWALQVCRGDFLKHLPRDFVDSLGKQRKYTGTRMLDLLRALRNKKNHYEDMSDKLKREVGPLPDGYLFFWTTRFSNLLITCWNVVYDVQWDNTDRFRDYYLPAGL